jgi:hypothetical protein
MQQTAVAWATSGGAPEWSVGQYPEFDWCGDPHCLNGPPLVITKSRNDDGTPPVRFDTHTLCIPCSESAPDVYDLKLVPLPAALKPRVSAKGRVLPPTTDTIKKAKTIRKRAAISFRINECRRKVEALDAEAIPAATE